MPLSELPPAMGVDPDAMPGAEQPLIRVAPPGPMSRSWAARLARTECPSCFEPGADQQPPVVYASAFGSNVVDVDCNRYVDLAASFGAILLGHQSPRPARALEGQAQRAWAALGDLYPADAKVAMLERVTSLFPSPGARALLCQSGSDAITAAIKTAVLATGRPGVLAFEGAYHGMGYASLAACGYRDSFRAPFASQLNPQVRFAPFPRDDSQLDRALQAVHQALRDGTIGAVLVEPIQGRAGCIAPPASFLPALVEEAHAAGALVIADEIWSGLGRCGALLACERVGVAPDILCLGKGLGGGLPISACVASDAIMQAWRRTPGVIHTSTFQGNALACATGVATIDAVRQGKLAQRAQQVGARFMDGLRQHFAASQVVRDITGAGLMVGIWFDTGATAHAIQEELLRRGYLVVTGGQSGQALTITPPLTIDFELLEGFAKELARVVDELPNDAF